MFKKTFQTRHFNFTCCADFQRGRRQLVSFDIGRRKKGLEDNTEIFDQFYPEKKNSKNLDNQSILQWKKELS